MNITVTGPAVPTQPDYTKSAKVEVGLPLTKIYSDILLGVSPLVLMMVKRFAEDAARGGLIELHKFIAANRDFVRRELIDCPGVRFMDPDSHASVERVHLGARYSMDVWSLLQERNVYVLPCQKFHWARPAEGDHSIRIALSRSPASIAAGTKVLRSVLRDG